MQMRFTALAAMAFILAFGASPTGQARDAIEDRYGARDMLVYVPDTLPPPGSRALVVVLHGGVFRRSASSQGL